MIQPASRKTGTAVRNHQKDVPDPLAGSVVTATAVFFSASRMTEGLGGIVTTENTLRVS